MSIAFIKPNYPNEKRVALLPNHLRSLPKHCAFGEIFIEEGFGAHLDIPDDAYRDAGCRIATREECFALPTIFSLKLIQRSDYPLLRDGQRIIGWMHPYGSGRYFSEEVARNRGITVFDIDSACPRIFRPMSPPRIVTELPPHFLWRNSYIAGIAATKLGLQAFSIASSGDLPVCVLGTGHVSQGAFFILSKLGMQPRMFGRKTMPIFYSSMHKYALIVNGIEMDADGIHILDTADLNSLREDVAIIDAAADAGRAIVGTEYQNIDNPVGQVCSRKYLLVNNAPTLMHKEASEEISLAISSFIITNDYF